MKESRGWKGNGGDGRGNSGLNLQPEKTVEISGVVSQGQGGTLLTNSTRIFVLTLRAGENTRDVLEFFQPQMGQFT